MDGQGGITFEHREDGPNGWSVILTGGLVGVGLIIVALAIFSLANWLGAALASLAQYVGVGALLVAGGQFAVQASRGAAMIIEAKGRARAMEREAEGRYVAEVRRARIMPPQHHESPWREVDD
jgi:ABC-type nickel/cobalt efflux system permease component RcnA